MSEPASDRRHVFISHSSVDKASAYRVCAALEKAGVRCWIGPRDTSPGAYGSSIMSAIKKARLFLLILSPNSDRSQNVLTEVGQAFKQHVPLLPFRLSDFEVSDAMSFYIHTQHHIDGFPGSLDQYLPLLTERVREVLAVTSGKVKSSPPPPQNTPPQAPEYGLPGSAAPRDGRPPAAQNDPIGEAIGRAFHQAKVDVGNAGVKADRFAKKLLSQRRTKWLLVICLSAFIWVVVLVASPAGGVVLLVLAIVIFGVLLVIPATRRGLASTWPWGGSVDEIAPPPSKTAKTGERD